MSKHNIKNPRIYTLSAVIIGYALIGNYTATEQNALANWFLLIGQILETNSGFQQIINNRNNNTQNQDLNINTNIIPSDEELQEIKNMINFINSKLDELCIKK